MSTVTETVFDRVGRRFGYDERSAAVLVMPVFIVLLTVSEKQRVKSSLLAEVGAQLQNEFSDLS